MAHRLEAMDHHKYEAATVLRHGVITVPEADGAVVPRHRAGTAEAEAADTLRKVCADPLLRR